MINMNITSPFILCLQKIMLTNIDCDIHNQRPFFVYNMKILKKWQIPLNGSVETDGRKHQQIICRGCSTSKHTLPINDRTHTSSFPLSYKLWSDLNRLLCSYIRPSVLKRQLIGRLLLLGVFVHDAPNRCQWVWTTLARLLLNRPCSL